MTGWSVAGSGASIRVWLDVLTGVTGLPATARRSGQAASAGAALLAATATGLDWGIDQLDPVGLEVEPNPAVVERYAELSIREARVAEAVLDLAADPTDPADPAGGGAMRVRLAYGTEAPEVEVPEDATVVASGEQSVLADPSGAVRASLAHPLAGPALGDLVPRQGEVVVVFPDLTRPMPNTTVLPPLLAELERAGAGPERVQLLCATGTHRQATPAEMAALVGPDIVGRYRIHDHDADDGAHVPVGEVDGTPVLLERRYVEAGMRILTGFVEPHFFAGWSGGPKGTCPGLAATSTILEAHSPERIADPRSTWLVTEGNPVHDFVRAATALCPPDCRST